MQGNDNPSVVRQLIPPLFSRILKNWKKYGWKGDYPNWQEAKKMSAGYDDQRILEKVKEAALQVKQGKAVYERDSVLFSRKEYSWPLLSSLLWVAIKNKGSLRVADLGGSLGSSYIQNRDFLEGLTFFRWNIIEQEKFVKTGIEFFQDDTLRFFYSMEQLVSEQGLPDIVVLSCVLPYLEKPYEVLQKLMDFNIPYILIDNTYFNYEDRDRICIHRVSPDIYDASYPCWMLNYSHVKGELTRNYHLISEHDNEFSISLDGRNIRYRGLFLKKQA